MKMSMSRGWKPRSVTGLVGLVVAAAFAAEPAKPLYENDFARADLDKVPAEFLVIDGQFGVREEGGNRFLELPGAPLETFGVLFGPAEKDGIAVGARIFGTSKGRRFPTFGVSLNGVSGYRLQLAPAKRQIELLKGDQILTAAPFAWEAGRWTSFRLQIRKLAEGGWRVEGKAWLRQGAADSEPDAWTLVLDQAAEPTAGRPGVWGSPFSGTPIRFDDLSVTRVETSR